MQNVPMRWIEQAEERQALVGGSLRTSANRTLDQQVEGRGIEVPP